MATMPKVRYTRKEYRDDYLKSDHWKTLRGYIVKSGVLCFKCKVEPATDAHHMRYRNIVTVKIKDLVPLCRECHNIVEEAKSLGLIRKSHSTVAVLKINREKIILEKKRLASKTKLPDSLIDRMISQGSQCCKLVLGILRRSVYSRNDWSNVLVTGRQLDQIRRIVFRNWKNGVPSTLRYITSSAPSRLKNISIHY